MAEPLRGNSHTVVSDNKQLYNKMLCRKRGENWGRKIMAYELNRRGSSLNKWNSQLLIYKLKMPFNGTPTDHQVEGCIVFKWLRRVSKKASCYK